MWYLQDLTQEQLQSRFAATPAPSSIAALLGANSPHVSTPVTMQEFLAHVRTLEQSMYERGWTMIGSRNKVPNLHKWKDPSREEMHQWAQDNLQSAIANSLNIRLADTSTIALDCDFNSPELMQAFITVLRAYLFLSPDEIYTCAGKKGAKIFFRYLQVDPDESLPRALGYDCYSPHHDQDNDFKQVLEIKSDLSTMAGLYGKVNNKMVVYGPYEFYQYIAAASPYDLPKLTLADIQALNWRYCAVCSTLHMRFTGDNGERIMPEVRQGSLLEEALCSVILLTALMQPLYTTSCPLQYALFCVDTCNFFDMLQAWLLFAGQYSAYLVLEYLWRDGMANYHSPLAETRPWQDLKDKLRAADERDAWHWVWAKSNRLFSQIQADKLRLHPRIAMMAGRELSIEDARLLTSAVTSVPFTVMALSKETKLSLKQKMDLFRDGLKRPQLKIFPTRKGPAMNPSPDAMQC